MAMWNPCKEYKNFEFRQCGTYTIKDGKPYKIQPKDLCKQANLANIDYKKYNMQNVKFELHFAFFIKCN